MKKVLASSVVVLMVLFLSAGLGLAGHGKGGGGTGGGSGTGGGGGTPIHDILAGTPFTVTGNVIDIVVGGGVLITSTEADEDVIIDEYVDKDGDVVKTATIYGIGPVRYWDSLEGVDRLAVGDLIKVNGFVVDYNGVDRNIAVTITVGGVTVELRDSDGVPLWRQKGGNIN